MQKLLSKPFSFLSAFAACFIMMMSTGCASGGFKLTRQLAGWLNSQQIIVRIILYILGSVIFAVTLLIDTVIFNTMDFWNGTVSAGTYNFKEGAHTYYVQHEIAPGTKLRRSTIQIMDQKNTLLQEVVLNETTAHEIEMFVDGQLRTRVSRITDLPVATLYGPSGKVLREDILLPDSMVASLR